MRVRVPPPASRTRSRASGAASRLGCEDAGPRLSEHESALVPAEPVDHTKVGRSRRGSCGRGVSIRGGGAAPSPPRGGAGGQRVDGSAGGGPPGLGPRSGRGSSGLLGRGAFSVVVGRLARRFVLRRPGNGAAAGGAHRRPGKTHPPGPTPTSRRRPSGTARSSCRAESLWALTSDTPSRDCHGTSRATPAAPALPTRPSTRSRP